MPWRLHYISVFRACQHLSAINTRNASALLSQDKFLIFF